MRQNANFLNNALEALKNKNTLFALLSVAVLAVVSLAYFYPDAIMGNVL